MILPSEPCLLTNPTNPIIIECLSCLSRPPSLPPPPSLLPLFLLHSSILHISLITCSRSCFRLMHIPSTSRKTPLSSQRGNLVLIPAVHWACPQSAFPRLVYTVAIQEIETKEIDPASVFYKHTLVSQKPSQRVSSK